MGVIKQKCPYCGSGNIATYKYGYPHFDENMIKKLDSGEWILGGCCLDVVGEGDEAVVMNPSRRCNDCKKDFGKPPVIVSRDRRKVEYYADIVISIELYIGRFFGGTKDIFIEKNEEGALLIVDRLPHRDQIIRESLKEIYETLEDPKKIMVTREKWDNLLETLYNDMHLHEWKKRFVDSHVLDGTQWSLEVTLTDRRKRRYYGGNEYPPYWKQLLDLMKEYAELEELY